MQIPDSETVLSDLAEITPLLYRSVDTGVSAARSYFFNEAREIEPYLFCHIVRFQAKQVLLAEGYSVEDFECEDLANSGLAITVGGFPIKIRKGSHGQLPAPQSQSLIEFYEQQQLKLTFPSGLSVKPNLMVLWDVDRPAYTMNQTLVLACPAAVIRSDVPCHWKVPIPRHAQSFSPPPVQTLPTEPVDDLDLRPIVREEDEQNPHSVG